MRIAPDTNVLVRALVGDDPDQGRTAREVLREAETVILTLPMLCELVWVMMRAYKIPREEVHIAIEKLVNVSNAVASRPAVSAGLAHLRAGGDFADGVLAAEGFRLGADRFVSFDATAVRLVAQAGGASRLLV